jgi:DNA-binding beta-propeller fold protein YncE
MDLQVFNGATCNATIQSDCSAVSVAALPANFIPFQPGIERTTHTVYVPLTANPDILGETLGYTAVIDGSTCNGTDHSGCGQAPQLVQVGGAPQDALVDRTTETVYVLNQTSASLSVIDASKCNGKNLSGCPKRVPALAAGLSSILFALNPGTHTIYQPAQLTNNVWVLDAAQCNGQHLEGCTKFAPVTRVGVVPVGLKENPDTHSLYVANAGDDNTGKSVSIIDTTQCNQSHPEGCNRTWPKFYAPFGPRFFGLNRATNTIYLSLLSTNNVAVINGATCNSNTTSGCDSFTLTPVGHVPQQVEVDEATNTIYVVNQGDGVSPSTMSILDGTHCNGTDTSGCNQKWPVAPVGVSPQGITFNPSDHTVYVTDTNDNTVSVIDTTHCNAGDHSNCTPVATFPVGAGPRAAGVVRDTNTLFVANRDDLSVSVIDSSTCNGSNTSGCPHTPPPAIVVGAFPETGGAGVENIVGRSVTIDQERHVVLLPVPGDADVVQLDGNSCTANNMDGCRPKVIPRRMGGFALCAELSESANTVYVTNNADATVSVFPRPE